MRCHGVRKRLCRVHPTTKIMDLRTKIMMRSRLIGVFRLLLVTAGIGALAYPYVSEMVNSAHSSKAIAGYESAASAVSEEDVTEILERAKRFNRALAEKKEQYGISDEDHEEYLSCLDLDGSGIMGYVEIPKLSVKLPIYHGTDAAVLQEAAGHMEGSSLPVGGESTHSVISGHTGMSNANLFTRLTEMEEEDVFYLHVLGRRMTYRVDSIEVILPEEIDRIRIVPGEDRCTLLTCTPYGVNSHRLLVHGIRTEDDYKKEEAPASVEKIVEKAKRMNKQDKMFLACIAAIVLAAVAKRIAGSAGGRKKEKPPKKEEAGKEEDGIESD